MQHVFFPTPRAPLQQAIGRGALQRQPLDLRDTGGRRQRGARLATLGLNAQQARARVPLVLVDQVVERALIVFQSRSSRAALN